MLQEAKEDILMSIDDSKTSNVSSSTPIVVSSASFSSADAAPTVTLSVKNFKIVVNDSKSRKNKIMLMSPGWMLPNYVQ